MSRIHGYNGPPVSAQDVAKPEVDATIQSTGSTGTYCTAHPEDELVWACLRCWRREASDRMAVYEQRDVLSRELELAADTFRDFSNVLRVIGHDTMSAAAAIVERHIREMLAKGSL